MGGRTDLDGGEFQDLFQQAERALKQVFPGDDQVGFGGSEAATGAANQHNT